MWHLFSFTIFVNKIATTLTWTKYINKSFYITNTWIYILYWFFDEKFQNMNSYAKSINYSQKCHDWKIAQQLYTIYWNPCSMQTMQIKSRFFSVSLIMNNRYRKCQNNRYRDRVWSFFSLNIIYFIRINPINQIKGKWLPFGQIINTWLKVLIINKFVIYDT